MSPSPLAQWPRWHDRAWAHEQLLHHLDEVKQLLLSGDPHFGAELADLALIAGFLADPEMGEKRLEKFAAKAAADQP